MSENKSSRRAMARVAEVFAWAIGVAASVALGFGLFSLAGQPFTASIGDPLALPKELAVTSQGAEVPLPPANADRRRDQTLPLIPGTDIPAPPLVVGQTTTSTTPAAPSADGAGQ